MASIMARDPWSWTVAEVKHFFKRYADAAVAGMEGVDLPRPINELNKQISSQGISGSVLLLSGNEEFVRRKLQISGIGARAAVIRCIELLQERSETYNSRKSPASWGSLAPVDDSMDVDETETEHHIVKFSVPSRRLIEVLAAINSTNAVPDMSQLLVAPESMQPDGMREAAHEPPSNLPTNEKAGAPQTQEAPEPMDLDKQNSTLPETTDHTQLKKRRRADLTTVSTDIAKKQRVFDADDYERFLPKIKQTIDNAFFGETKMGKDIVEVSPDQPGFIDEEGDEENFQFIQGSEVQRGMVAYIGSQMQRCMYTEDVEPLTRHGKYAEARFPYRLSLQAERTTEESHHDHRGRILFQGSRSAMVVQHRAGKLDNSNMPAYFATRESDALLESGAQELGYDQDLMADLNGEYDHLLLKWRSGGDDEELMPLATDEGSSNADNQAAADVEGHASDVEAGSNVGDESGNEAGDDASDTEDDGESGDDNASDTEDDGGSGDDMAEVVKEVAFKKRKVKRIFQEAIDRYETAWQEHKLPKIEATQTWTIWKLKKRNDKVRDHLIRGARGRIQQFDARLDKYKRQFLQGNWDTLADLEKQCEVLEVTVEDRMLEFWKIDVWQLRQEPDHVTNRRAPHNRAQAPAQAPPTSSSLPLRNLADDCISAAPRDRSPSPLPMDLDGEDDKDTEMDEERFHTPEGSPTPPGLGLDGFVVPEDDEDDEAQDDEDDEQATAGASMEEDSPAHGTDSSGVFKRPGPVQRGGPSTPAGKSRATPSRTPSSARWEQTAGVTSSSQSASPRGKRAAASPAVSIIDMTGISSDEASPRTPHAVQSLKAPPKKLGRPRKDFKMETPVKAEMPSSSALDGHVYDDLMREGDRDTILQVLLRHMSREERENLHKIIQKLTPVKFRGQMIDCLKAIGNLEADEKEEVRQKTGTSNAHYVRLGVRLLLAWYFPNPDIVEKKIMPANILTCSMPTGLDCMNFMQKLRHELHNRNSQLYSAHKPTSYESPQEIKSSDDDFDPADTGLDDDTFAPESAKKRKNVKVDLAAKGLREAARARLDQAKESQNQQSSNPELLRGMIQPQSAEGGYDINTLRKPEQDPIYVDAKMSQAMKSYQVEGVRFLWRELTADVKGAQGCLLAHTMGLGKTMQSIALLSCVDNASQSPSDSVSGQLPQDLQLGSDRNKRSLRILVLCPSSLLPNWLREIKQWAPLGAFGGHVIAIESAGQGSGYLQSLERWSQHGGILLIGYPLLRIIVQHKTKEVKEKDQSKPGAAAKVDRENAEKEIACRILTQDAELVVADEAHALKNSSSAIAMAASKFETTARIALTGTPMSNDVDEIYSLVSWVTPDYLGDKSQFNHFFGLPIKGGLYVESTKQERRWSTIKLKSLHHQIEPKVHRAGISVLKGELKPKVEFVLTVELTEQQRTAYAATVAALLGTDSDLDNTALTRIFSWLGVLGLLTAHPRCFRQKLLTPVPEKDPRAKKAAAKRRLSMKPAAARIDDEDVAIVEPGDPESKDVTPLPGDEDVYALGFTKAIVDALVENVSDDIDPSLSAKSRLLQRILRLSKKCGDKVLIFSASIPTLDYLTELLTSDRVKFGRIDGSMRMSDRTKLLAEFQKRSTNLDVLLISTRAGGQGLNIQNANRVIIFDFGFNPAWEEQAIGRAYRFGQTKPVFVYRFVAGGTFESNIYNTQMFKTSLSSRVVDKNNPKRNATRNTKKYLYPPEEVKHEDLENELQTNLDPEVMSKIMQAQLDRGEARDPSIDICCIRTMEVLQREADDEEVLNDEEMLLVEQNKTTWEGSKGSNFRIPLPTITDHTLYPWNDDGVPISTMPAPPPPGVPRTNTTPSATQVPAYPIPGTFHPQPPSTAPQAHGHGYGHGHTPSTSLPPADLRAQAEASRAPSASSFGGLPYPKPS